MTVVTLPATLRGPRAVGSEDAIAATLIRTLWIAWVVVGCTAYAASFALRGWPGFTATAGAIATAAAVSWLALLTVMLLFDRQAAGRDVIDLCVTVAALGTVSLTLAASANALVWLFTLPLGTPTGADAAFHTLVLAMSQSVMTVTFFVNARRLGLTALRIAWLWFGVLDGTFAVLMTVWWWGAVR